MAWSAGPLPAIIITCQDLSRRDSLVSNLRRAKTNLSNNGRYMPFEFKAYTIGNEAKNVLWSIDFLDGGDIPNIPTLLIAFEDLLPSLSHVPVYLVKRQPSSHSLPVNLGDSPNWVRGKAPSWSGENWAIEAVAERDCPHCRATVAGPAITPPPPPPPVLPPPVLATVVTPVANTSRPIHQPRPRPRPPVVVPPPAPTSAAPPPPPVTLPPTPIVAVPAPAPAPAPPPPPPPLPALIPSVAIPIPVLPAPPLSSCRWMWIGNLQSEPL